MPRTTHYWLMKSEPSVYSIDDLKRDGSTCWDGVRNYQARNMMRNEMKIGDQVFFYHSNVKPMGIYGVAKVVREGYADDSAFDPDDPHYDSKSDLDNPTWIMVDIGYLGTFQAPVTLDSLKPTPGLEQMKVIQRGSRLSVQPVSLEEWAIVLAMAKLLT